MDNGKTVRKAKRKNTKLRLVKNNTENTGKKSIESQKAGPEKLRFGKSKRVTILLVTLLCIFAVLAAVYFYILNNYTITTIHVDGNVHYTDEEIIDMVMGEAFADNSIFLSMKYRNRGVDDIPFVQTMDVSVESKNSVRITVYEKAVAGYVAYLGRYMYFDKDGIVVETSEEKTEGVPQVTGLTFDHVILYERLPVENEEIFGNILNITQLLDKYDLPVDKIYFSPDYQVTILFDNVRVAMGDSFDIDEKIMRLSNMLPNLAGKSGTLDMTDFSEDEDTFSFEMD